jgi:hypothetical protein
MPHRILTAILGAFALMLVSASPARAESIIKHPGDHPNYSVELEPHLLLTTFFSHFAGNGFGIGGRFTIPLVENGFVSSINNNVGIGFGLDWAHYTGCYRNYGYYADCPSVNTFYIPVVMQWNFFFTTHLSAFGEIGLDLNYTSWPDNGYCWYDAQNHPHCDPFYGPYGGGHTDWDPFILAVGGRFHFSQAVAITARIGYPYISFGVSFFL